MIVDAAPGSYSLPPPPGEPTGGGGGSVPSRPPADCSRGPGLVLLSWTDDYSDIVVLLAHLETFQVSNQLAAEEVIESLNCPALFESSAVQVLS